jgi:hypothetical protein
MVSTFSIVRTVVTFSTPKIEREYLIGSLADCVGVTSDLLIRLIERVEGEKP